MKNYYVLSLGFLVSINLFSVNISSISQSPMFSPSSGQNVEIISYEEELISSLEFLDAQSITRSFFSNLLDSEYPVEDFEKELKNKTYSSFLMDNKLLFHPAIIEALQLYPMNSPSLLLSSYLAPEVHGNTSIDVQVGQTIQQNFKQMIDQYIGFYYQAQPQTKLQLPLEQVFQYINIFLPTLLNSYNANTQGIINIISSATNFARSFRHLDSTPQEIKINFKEGYGDMVCEFVLFNLLCWLEDQLYTNLELNQLREKISDIFYELSQVYSHIIEFNNRILICRKGGKYVNLKCVTSPTQYDLFTGKNYSDLYINKLNLIRVSMMLNNNNLKSAVRLLEYLSWDRSNLTSYETYLKQQNQTKSIKKPKVSLCAYSKQFLKDRVGHISLREGMVAYKFDAVKSFLSKL